MRKAGLLCLLAAMVAASGCGYHTVGHTSNLPQSIHSIDVPTFKNETTRFKIEQQVTQAVVRELMTRTKYNVRASEQPGDADAVLRGVISGFSSYQVVYDFASGHAIALVNVRAKVSLIDQKTKKVLYENNDLTYQEQYEISGQAATYFDESSAAAGRLSRQLAASLVSGMLSGF